MKRSPLLTATLFTGILFSSCQKETPVLPEQPPAQRIVIGKTLIASSFSEQKFANREGNMNDNVTLYSYYPEVQMSFEFSFERTSIDAGYTYTKTTVVRKPGGAMVGVARQYITKGKPGEIIATVVLRLPTNEVLIIGGPGGPEFSSQTVEVAFTTTYTPGSGNPPSLTTATIPGTKR